MPSTVETRRIAPQLIDAATSVHANYRASCKARTRAEFVAKMGIVAEEADESEAWLAILLELEIGATDDLQSFRREAEELTSIFTASFRTSRDRLQGQKSNPKNRNPKN